MLRRTPCAMGLVLGLALSSAAVGDTADTRGSAEAFADEVLAEIDRGREELALEPLDADPVLAAVAQRRVDAMANEGWFGFTSPDGEGIEQALDAAGYPFRLVTEKLVRTTDSPARLGASWRAMPDAHRNSVFHADIARIGIGVHEIGGLRLVDVVLASLAGDEAEAADGEPFDADRERSALEELLAERRREARCSRLRPDRPLEEAAQQHAEMLLAALASGRRADSIQPFGERLAEIERSYGRAGSGTATGGSKVWRRETGTQSRSTIYGDGSLAVAYVVDAVSADQALAALLASGDGPDLLDPGLRRFGVGVAVGGADGGPRVVWVAAAARR